MNQEAASTTDVRLALISHTNVGKTSLTRTLLRSDVGEVVDAPHTTMENTVHALATTDEGHRLLLWDTPGFGDSSRLKARLEQRGTAVGWFIGEVWDRVTDRALYSSQQAMLAARDLTDVILYQVNAAEDPEFATQVEAELAMLAWLEKPVILLLNQLPPHSRRTERENLEQRWRDRFGKAPVRRVLALDAFERSWIDEVQLLAAVGEVLPQAQQEAMARLLPVWQAKALERFQASIDAVTAVLITAILDREALSAGQPARLARMGALRRLAARLEAAVRKLDETLIRIEGLEGASARRIDTALTATRSHGDRPSPLQGAAGGAALGAGAGAAIDLALGGASLGLFTALGASLSAAAGWSWSQRAVDKRTLGWSEPFIEDLLAEAAARYLAVTHHGRGRGRYEGAALDSWRELADAAKAESKTEVAALLAAFDDPEPDRLKERAHKAVRSILTRALLKEYPHGEWIL
ncbi:MAG: GTPase domain-containing protein [Gammaproteobacteria bacterium]|nr:GTPase domain-containing protein [Gammaproteobacteria bacterium]